MKWYQLQKYLSSVIYSVFFWMIFLSSENTVHAVHVGEWPADLNFARAIFTPYLNLCFADVSGLVRFREQADNFNQYLFRNIPEQERGPRRCTQNVRKPGYIHTVRYNNENAPFMAQIAVPLRFKLQTQFLGQKKDHLLNSLLLKVKVLALNGDDGDQFVPGLPEGEEGEDSGSYKLEILRQFDFTVRDLCGLDRNCRPLINSNRLPISLDLTQVIVTDAFQIASARDGYRRDLQTRRYNMLNRGKIRIRVEWAFDGICDEDDFEFKIGDQIRLIEYFGP